MDIDHDHFATYAAESAGPVDIAWESWIDRVEDLLDRDPNGSLAADGYSIDTFHDMFEAGFTPRQASGRVRGAIHVTADGQAWQFVLGQYEPLFAIYRERWNVLTTDGFKHHADTLPDNAVQVHCPHRGLIPQVGVCSDCRDEVTEPGVRSDEFRASGMCPRCLHEGRSALEARYGDG